MSKTVNDYFKKQYKSNNVCCRNIAIDGTPLGDNKVYGWCHNNTHLGALTVAMAREHECLRKQCPFFKINEEHSEAKRKEVLKKYRKDNKILKRGGCLITENGKGLQIRCNDKTTKLELEMDLRINEDYKNKLFDLFGVVTIEDLQDKLNDVFENDFYRLFKQYCKVKDIYFYNKNEKAIKNPIKIKTATVSPKVAELNKKPFKTVNLPYKLN